MLSSLRSRFIWSRAHFSTFFATPAVVQRAGGFVKQASA